MDRTTSLGLWRYAEDFSAVAYTVISNSDRTLPPIPAYYLCCHAIELAIKAYLRGTGASIKKLRQIGHDLLIAYDIAIKNGINDVCVLTKEEIDAIILVNEIYLRKEFEYVRVGAKKLPDIRILYGAANSLVYGLRKFCFEKKDIHN